MARSIKNLIAALLIAISGYLAWTQILPDYTVISYLKEQVRAKGDLIVSRNEIIQKIQRLREENNSKYAELQRLALVVPEKKGMPELITAVESIYSRNGFILPQIGLGDSKEASTLGKIGLTTGANGTYGQFINFLSSFEKNIRLFDINSIDVGLESDSSGLSGSNDPKLNFTIGGQFYWLQPQTTTGNAQVEPVNQNTEN